jgi:transcriptional regulator PpsR
VSHAPPDPAAGLNALPDLGALSDLAPELAQTFVSIASDIALVVDAGGVIRNVAMGRDPITSAATGWVGRRWADTVTGDTQRKVEQLLSEANSAGVTRRREVSHPAQGGLDVPVAYAAIRLGRDGPVLAVGRDLRTVAAIQQRFVETQQELERDYWRQRQAESHRRQLLQAAHDAVLSVDPQELRILQANPAAGLLFGADAQHLVGRLLTDTMAPAARPGVHELLIMARATGRAAEMRALTHPLVLADAMDALPRPVDLSATPLRADDHMLLLVRARAAPSAQAPTASAVVHDAVVITDPSGRVLMANPLFLAGQDLASDADAVGRPLADLLGAGGSLVAPLLALTRREGLAQARGADGLELAATLMTEGDQACIGLVLRRSGVRPPHLPPQAAELALAVDRLARQIGLAALPDLLQEASDLAERHLIEAALSRSGGDARQAALLLGIGLDQLGQRLRHHRLGMSGHELPGTPPHLLN